MSINYEEFNEASRGVVLLDNILDMCSGMGGANVIAVLGTCIVDVIMRTASAEDRKQVVDYFCEFLKERVNIRTENEAKTNEKK